MYDHKISGHDWRKIILIDLWRSYTRYSSSTPLDLEMTINLCREQIMRISYRFWIFKSKPCGMVRFWPLEVRCGGTVHCNSDSRLSGLRLVLWFKSDRRQVVCTLRMVIGGRSVTDVVPSVQPGSGFGKKSNAYTPKGSLTWQVKSLQSL